MKQKRYRCPACGEACVTRIQRVYESGRMNRISGVFGTSCSSCGHLFVSSPRYPGKWLTVWSLAELLPLLLFILLAYLVTPLMLCGFVLYMVLYTAVILPWRISRTTGLTQYDQEARRPVKPEPNVRLALDMTGERIENLDIYGLRFEKQTRNARFREVFTDGLVPVIFYRDGPRESGPWKAALLKPEYIPSDLLAVGAAFTIVDNGEMIAKGTITELCGLAVCS